MSKTWNILLGVYSIVGRNALFSALATLKQARKASCFMNISKVFV